MARQPKPTLTGDLPQWRRAISHEEFAHAVARAMTTGDQSVLGDLWDDMGGDGIGSRYLRRTKAHRGKGVSLSKLDNEARFRLAFFATKDAEATRLGRKVTKLERIAVIDRLAGQFGIEIERAHKIADGEDKTVNARVKDLAAEIDL